jgi:hypothetical protein
MLLVEQRQSSVGSAVHVDVGKLSSTKLVKQVCAHGGMKLVSSSLRVIDASASVEDANRERIQSRNRHGLRISLGQHNAILVGTWR